MFNQATGKTSPLTISVGQALLLLIKKYRNDSDKMDELKRLYFLGAKDKASKNKIFNWLKDESLKEYNVSTDFNVINGDASRRYFETHLAHHTLKQSIGKLKLDDVKQHHNSLKKLISSLPITTEIVDDFLHCRFDNIEKNPHLNDGDKVNIKEYSDIISQLDLNYAKTKLIAENKLRKKPLNDIELEITLKNLSLEKNRFSDFSNEDKLKMKMMAFCSFVSTLTNKDLKDLPLDIYGEGYYKSENRGQVKKLEPKKNPDDPNEIVQQLEIKSQHLGSMRSIDPVPQNDIAMNATPFNYTRPTDRLKFNPEASWVIDNFSYLVHPFSCSISGTMLLHLRVFKELANKNMLAIDDKQKLFDYMQVFIPLMVYNSGGHSFHEFTYPYRLPIVQENFSFIKDFNQINAENLFLLNIGESDKQHETAFDQAINDAIQYNDIIINRAKIRHEIKDRVLVTPATDHYNNGLLTSAPHATVFKQNKANEESFVKDKSTKKGGISFSLKNTTQ